MSKSSHENLPCDSIRQSSAQQSTAPALPVPSAPAPVPDAPSTTAPGYPAPSLCLLQSHTRAPNSNTLAQIPASPGSTPRSFSSPLPSAPSANKECQDYSGPPDKPAAPQAPSANIRSEEHTSELQS